MKIQIELSGNEICWWAIDPASQTTEHGFLGAIADGRAKTLVDAVSAAAAAMREYLKSQAGALTAQAERWA